MFKKLISNLPFSPALVGQLGFYAKRLKKEEATRKIGLIFTALALVVQSFAVFSPPEAANASSPSDFVPGGVDTLSEYLRHYDANTNNIKDLFTALKITRSNLANASSSTFDSKGSYSWGLTSRFSYAQGERKYTIRTSSGTLRTFYYRPLSLWDSTSYTIKYGSTYPGYVGKTSSGMWFAIMKACGNLILKVIPPVPPCPTGMTGTYPNCTTPPPAPVVVMCTVPGKTNLPANDPGCKLDPVATCSSLTIDKIASNYQFTSVATVQNGATVKSYTYTVKRDGQVVYTTTVASTQTSNTYIYNQTKEGAYTVELTVNTSVGVKTSPNCVKTFNIAPPEVCPFNTSLPKNSPECQPCPGDSTIWIKDEKCAASVIQTKSAINTSQGGVDATSTAAKAGDKIMYTLAIANQGKAPTNVTIEEIIDDVSEYAAVIDKGGGTFNEETKTLTWPKITLQPGEKQNRMFTIQLASTIPAMGTGASDRTSYDCKMMNTFGNNVTIAVDCPIQKQIVERTVAELPHTGPRENMIFAAIVASVVVFFYARSRQLKKEVRLIRRDFNTGTI